MTRGDTEIYQITLKPIFYHNLHNRSGSLVCPSAQYYVLAVPIINVIDTNHLTENFMKNLK